MPGLHDAITTMVEGLAGAAGALAVLAVVVAVILYAKGDIERG